VNEKWDKTKKRRNKTKELKEGRNDRPKRRHRNETKRKNCKKGEFPLISRKSPGRFYSTNVLTKI
jgi:hypothetical protein